MATFNHIHRLEISWSKSRAHDTYGYNICRLDDSISGKRYRACSGNDMHGIVLGDWFQDQYQCELLALVEKNKHKLKVYSTNNTNWQKVKGMRGMTYSAAEGRVMLDGRCGVEFMIRIIEACGFEIEKSYDKRNECLRAFYVQKKAN